MDFLYWFDPRGRLSARAYRIFLSIYLFAVLPTFGAVFFSLIIIGVRSPYGMMHGVSRTVIAVATCFYSLGALWPVYACSMKRIRDLKTSPVINGRFRLSDLLFTDGDRE